MIWDCYMPKFSIPVAEPPKAPFDLDKYSKLVDCARIADEMLAKLPPEISAAYASHRKVLNDAITAEGIKQVLRSP